MSVINSFLIGPHVMVSERRYRICYHIMDRMPKQTQIKIDDANMYKYAYHYSGCMSIWNLRHLKVV